MSALHTGESGLATSGTKPPTIARSSQPDGIAAQDAAVAAQLKKALRSGNREAVAVLIRYPVARQSPLSPIQNAADFVRAFDDFFDKATIADVLSSELQSAGWRGPQLGRYIKIRNGLVAQVYASTSAMQDKARRAFALQESRIHPSARAESSEDLTDCATKEYRLRIRRSSKGEGSAEWTLFLWKGPSDRVPSVAVPGELEYAGSSGAFAYKFTKDSVTYRVSWAGDGADGTSDADVELTIADSKGPEEVLACHWLGPVTDAELESGR